MFTQSLIYESREWKTGGFPPAITGILLLAKVPCAGTFRCTDGCPVAHRTLSWVQFILTVPSCGAF